MSRQDNQSVENRKFPISTYLYLILILLVLLILDITIGSVTIPIKDIFLALSGNDAVKESWQNIIIEFRIPKALTAILVGAGLSVSGLQMQTLFRNPLAGPFVLGISSGASLGVALLVLASNVVGNFILNFGIATNWLIVIAATGGASIVFIIVSLVSVRIKDSMGLLIIGLMFGSATGAAVSILQYFSNAYQIQNFLIWTFGNLGGVTWNEMNVFIPVTLLGLAISLLLSKQLNALLLGENYARSLGVNIQKTRIWLIISTSLLAGSITAFCGPIAFVGTAVPHLSRMIFSTSDHKYLTPIVIISGIIFMLLCDIASLAPGNNRILPINAVTSLICAPIVIWIILRKKNVRRSLE